MFKTKAIFLYFWYTFYYFSQDLQLRLYKEQATVQDLTTQLQEQGTEKVSSLILTFPQLFICYQSILITLFLMTWFKEKELLAVIARQKATEDELALNMQQLAAMQEQVSHVSLELSNSHNVNLQLEKAKKDMEVCQVFFIYFEAFILNLPWIRGLSYIANFARFSHGKTGINFI